jgi:IclR family transcriptional regulator, KDG regulon repressor
MKDDKRQIQSIKRATDLMGMFIDENKPLGITDFSKRLGLPKTTIAGIVSTLVSVGYLEKFPFTAKYRLGPQLLRLGMKCTTNTDLISIGRLWLERLCLQFTEPVNMGVLARDKVAIIMRIEPRGRYVVFPQDSPVIPMHTTALGKILLAHIDSTRRERILAGCRFEKLTPNTITTHELFLEELEQVKTTGISFDNQETVIGIAAISGPIFNRIGEIIAAFSVAGNCDNIMRHRNDIIEAVKYTSNQASAQLGFTG